MFYKIAYDKRVVTLPDNTKLNTKAYSTSEDGAWEVYNAKQAAIKADYIANKPEAERTLDQAEREFYALQKRLGVSIDYTYEGDTHGIYDEHMYISTTVNGHEYTRRLED